MQIFQRGYNHCCGPVYLAICISYMTNLIKWILTRCLTKNVLSQLKINNFEYLIFRQNCSGRTVLYEYQAFKILIFKRNKILFVATYTYLRLWIYLHILTLNWQIITIWMHYIVQCALYLLIHTDNDTQYRWKQHQLFVQLLKLCANW